MDRQPEFLLLRPTFGWIDGENWKCLLGSAVQYPPSPLQSYVPDNPRKYVEKPVRIEENHYDNFILGQNFESAKSGGFALKNLFTLRASKSVQNELDLTGKLIHVKRLAQHNHFWNKVTKDENFVPFVTTCLREEDYTKHTCLVVGLLICQDVKLALSEEDAREHELEYGLPLSTIGEKTLAAHGINLKTDGTGNLEGKLSSSKRVRKYFAAEGEGERLFALELRRISLKGGGDLKLEQNPPKSAHKLGSQTQENVEFSETKLDDSDWNALEAEVGKLVEGDGT